MIETTIAATAAKARRNAILAVIPRAYITDLLEAARQVARKNQKPLEQIRVDMLDYFARTYRVESQQIFDYLAIKGVDDISLDHIDELRAVSNAIKEGEPAETYFGKSKTKAEIAKEKVAARTSKKSPAESIISMLTAATTEAQYEAAGLALEKAWDELSDEEVKRINAVRVETFARLGL
jgi:hypothetical protein